MMPATILTLADHTKIDTLQQAITGVGATAFTTADAYTTNHNRAHRCTLQAGAGNAGKIWVGDKNLDSTNIGFIIPNGDSYTIPGAGTNDIYFESIYIGGDTNNDTVNVLWDYAG